MIKVSKQTNAGEELSFYANTTVEAVTADISASLEGRGIPFTYEEVTEDGIAKQSIHVVDESYQGEQNTTLIKVWQDREIGTEWPDQAFLGSIERPAAP